MHSPVATPAVDPAAAFALLYPRLRLVKECGDDFVDITVDGAAADLIEAGLLTQEMLDALPPCGRKDFYFCEDTRDCSAKVSKVKAGVRINLWGKGFQMEVLRNKLGIKAKPVREQLISETDLKAVEQLVEKLAAVAKRLPPVHFRDEFVSNIELIDSLALYERKCIAAAKSKARPYLRLVVDNEVRP